MPDLLQRLARVAPYLRGGRAGIVAAALGTLVAAATEPVIPALMKPLLDEGFTAGELPLWLVPVVIVGLFLVRGVAGFVARFGLAWAAQHAMLEMRRDMFAHLLAAPAALYAHQSASQLTNTVVYEVQQGTTMLVNALLTLARSSLTLVALLAYLLWLNWPLTMFVAVLFPLLALIVRALGRRLRRLTADSQRATDELAYVVEENALAWRIVRLHGAEQAQAGRFARRSESLRRLLLKYASAAGVVTPTTQLLTACALSAVIVAALWQSSGQGHTVGGFVAFITAMLMIVAPLKNLSDVMAPVQRGLAAIERGLDLMAVTPRESGGAHAPQRARGEIVFDAVTLHYRDDAIPALAGFSLAVPAGRTVALVGPSGAGKSTVVSLLARFLDPGSGSITLDGVALRDWNLQVLRRQFALVSQNVVLFNDTVAANVALGEGPPDDSRVLAALEAAYLLDFVRTLPEGAATVIGHDGSQLSGGQRQRLAIARAIYKDAPILLLDEATSALDSESERAVQAALEVLMKGRTTLIVAHRLSTIEHADLVVAMDSGRVVEQGPPAQLLAAGGLYARLHAMQFRT